jgi:nitroreductase/FMN reductase [NAD(P)H]
MTIAENIEAMVERRFGEEISVAPGLGSLDTVARIAGRATQRRYSDRTVDHDLLLLLCACALSAPSKSDLQQRDIIVVRDRGLRDSIAVLIPDMPWVAAAPAFLVFCANGRRLPTLARMRGKPFANDHFDLLFNAVGDAAIALATFVCAAEAIGLGCCAISVIRDHAARVSELLHLPQRVIPFAGLCIGWPAEEGRIVPRLPLSTTVHVDRFRDEDFAAHLAAYDARRERLRPYSAQRDESRWGRAGDYSWSEDKARQYAEPQRRDFGAFVRERGFNLE